MGDDECRREDARIEALIDKAIKNGRIAPPAMPVEMKIGSSMAPLMMKGFHSAVNASRSTEPGIKFWGRL